MIKFFIILIFFLLSLGQLGRISFLGQQVNFYLYEIAVVALVLTLLTAYRLQPIISFMKKYPAMLFFFFLMLFSFLLRYTYYSFQENFIAFLYFLRFFTYVCLFIYLARYWQDQKKSNTVVQSGILVLSSITIVFSLTQYFLYPDLRNLFYLGWDPHLYRTFGVFFDTSISAALYGILLFYFVIKREKLRLPSIIYDTFVGIFIILGLLTYSRGFYIASLLTFSYYYIRQKQYLGFFVIFILFTGSLFLLPKQFGEGVNLLRRFSVTSRLRDDQTAISIWQKNPLLGIGYNRIRYEKERLGVIDRTTEDITHAGASFHSSFLIVLVTTGILGLISFLFLLWQLAKISLFSTYLTLFLSLFSLWDNILLHPFILMLFFLLLSREVFQFSGE